jgi:7,8-dihydropterin-6-yl-methyl-4-(beta-D-ribofuranosyl)aminobenzene 5'-phosphate synthase
MKMDRMKPRRFFGTALVLIAVLVCCFGYSAESPGGRILVIYDNIPGGPNSNLSLGPGFAAWIEVGGKAVLFDTGGDSKTLGDNLRKSNLELREIAAAVISHDHGDHTGGLPLLAGLHLNVYIPQSSNREAVGGVPGLTLIPVDASRQILPGVWTTGQLTADYRGELIAEQALIVEYEDGLVVVTGCAHVGIVEIVKAAKALFPQKKIKLVAGGFHLRDFPEDKVKAISDAFKELGVEKVGPSHCTGGAAIELFKKEWKDDFVRFHLGDQYSF